MGMDGHGAMGTTGAWDEWRFQTTSRFAFAIPPGRKGSGFKLRPIPRDVREARGLRFFRPLRDSSEPELRSWEGAERSLS